MSIQPASDVMRLAVRCDISEGVAFSPELRDFNLTDEQLNEVDRLVHKHLELTFGPPTDLS